MARTSDSDGFRTSNRKFYAAHRLRTDARSRLIMAWDTGKTFTSLEIGEEPAGKGKRVHFLVSSLNRLSTTLTEWDQERTSPLRSFGVCLHAGANPLEFCHFLRE